jgi:hypothetical protein
MVTAFDRLLFGQWIRRRLEAAESHVAATKRHVEAYSTKRHVEAYSGGYDTEAHFRAACHSVAVARMMAFRDVARELGMIEDRRQGDDGRQGGKGDE